MSLNASLIVSGNISSVLNVQIAGVNKDFLFI